VNDAYPDISKMIEVKGISHPGSFTRKSFEIMDVMTEREDIDADFIFYSGNLPIFRIRRDRTPYIYFCHTPERGFFDLRDELDRKMRSWGSVRYRVARRFFEKRRKMDLDLFTNVVNPKQVVTNSRLIMDRYEKAYGKRPRAAVGAPIDTGKFRSRESEDFFFTASGLRFNKRIEWQIRAVAEAGVKLVIAGDGDERQELEKLSGKLEADVEFLGRVGDRELVDLYSRCKAFIFTAKDEDFGMVPLEAMASGKPVLCVNEGGPLEYLDPSNSMLFDDIDGLVKLLEEAKDQDLSAMKENCIETAKRYDTKVVASRIRNEIDSIMEEFY
jgi:glycosyltransferase involved in cell wall biosynthesis